MPGVEPLDERKAQREASTREGYIWYWNGATSKLHAALSEGATVCGQETRRDNWSLHRQDAPPGKDFAKLICTKCARNIWRRALSRAFDGAGGAS